MVAFIENVSHFWGHKLCRVFATIGCCAALLVPTTGWAQIVYTYPGPATDIEVVLGSQTQSASFPALGAGNTVTLTFDLAQDSAVQAAAPGQTLDLTTATTVVARGPEVLVTDIASSPLTCLDTAANPLSRTLSFTKAPIGGTSPVAVPLLGLGGLLALAGLVAGIAGWRVRTSGPGRAAILLGAMAIGGFMALTPAQMALAQMAPELCSPAVNALSDMTVTITGNIATVTVTRVYP